MNPYTGPVEFDIDIPLKGYHIILFNLMFKEKFNGLSVEEVLEIVKEKYPEKFI